jgi:hypothetical protein
MMTTRRLFGGRRAATATLLVHVAVFIARPGAAGEDQAKRSVFVKDNLVAWCIVPFDAKKRGPAERAAMLQRLGIRKVAYDWRQQHVATFEDEIIQYRKHGLEYFAFWGQHEEALRLFQQHGLRPQIWTTLRSPKKDAQTERVEAAGRAMLPLAERTRELGCKLGLYNHGGWGGEPKYLVAVCRWLREHGDAAHVGVVYNLHHGHDHIHDFAESLAVMKPYLLCLNVNGMNDNAEPKILPLGMGQHDEKMLRIIAASGYRGPIGVLDHRSDTDAEQSLRENLDGLKRLLGRMGDQDALATY